MSLVSSFFGHSVHTYCTSAVLRDSLLTVPMYSLRHVNDK